MDRPIPAFYCCYLLRSTVKHSSVYVGSTPNPVRRLAQHNGVIKGGAVRTSRISLRPWEMTCIVTGFPSHIAALQFEWAWQNPHVTLHIPPESRIQHATSKKQSGHPKRPRHTVSSLLSNLHILLSVPSFSRWPLELLFFSESVQKIWQKSCKTSANKVPDPIILTLDSEPTEPLAIGSSPRGKNNKSLHGIKELTVDYCDYKLHVEKAKEIIEFEQEGSCSVCQVKLEHSKGIYTVCPRSGCEAVTHMTCLSKHFLQSDADAVIPIKGTCPSCRSEVRWVDIVKELSLRMRGQREVEKLLKVRKVVKGKRKDDSAFQALDSPGEEDDALEACMEFNPEPDSETVDRWQASDDRDGSDFESTTSNGSRTRCRLISQSACSALAIGDSDWEDAPMLD